MSNSDSAKGRKGLSKSRSAMAHLIQSQRQLSLGSFNPFDLVSPSGSAEPVSFDSNPHVDLFEQVLTALSKKDDKNRISGLQSFVSTLEKHKEDKEFWKCMTKYFPSVYGKAMDDPLPQVRELGQSLLKNIVFINGKKYLSNVMDGIVGPWLSAFWDIESNVLVSEAKALFDEVFDSLAKQEKVLSSYLKSILAYLKTLSLTRERSLLIKYSLSAYLFTTLAEDSRSLEILGPVVEKSLDVEVLHEIFAQDVSTSYVRISIYRLASLFKCSDKTFQFLKDNIVSYETSFNALPSIFDLLSSCGNSIDNESFILSWISKNRCRGLLFDLLPRLSSLVGVSDHFISSVLTTCFTYRYEFIHEWQQEKFISCVEVLVAFTENKGILLDEVYTLIAGGIPPFILVGPYFKGILRLLLMSGEGSLDPGSLRKLLYDSCKDSFPLWYLPAIITLSKFQVKNVDYLNLVQYWASNHKPLQSFSKLLLHVPVDCSPDLGDFLLSLTYDRLPSNQTQWPNLLVLVAKLWNNRRFSDFRFAQFSVSFKILVVHELSKKDSISEDMLSSFSLQLEDLVDFVLSSSGKELLRPFVEYLTSYRSFYERVLSLSPDELHVDFISLLPLPFYDQSLSLKLLMWNPRNTWIMQFKSFCDYSMLFNSFFEGNLSLSLLSDLVSNAESELCTLLDLLGPGCNDVDRVNQERCFRQCQLLSFYLDRFQFVDTIMTFSGRILLVLEFLAPYDTSISCLSFFLRFIKDSLSAEALTLVENEDKWIFSLENSLSNQLQEFSKSASSFLISYMEAVEKLISDGIPLLRYLPSSFYVELVRNNLKAEVLYPYNCMNEVNPTFLYSIGDLICLPEQKILNYLVQDELFTNHIVLLNMLFRSIKSRPYNMDIEVFLNRAINVSPLFALVFFFECFSTCEIPLYLRDALVRDHAILSQIVESYFSTFAILPQLEVTDRDITRSILQECFRSEKLIAKIIHLSAYFFTYEELEPFLSRLFDELSSNCASSLDMADQEKIWQCLFILQRQFQPLRLRSLADLVLPLLFNMLTNVSSRLFYSAWHYYIRFLETKYEQPLNLRLLEWTVEYFKTDDYGIFTQFFQQAPPMSMLNTIFSVMNPLDMAFGYVQKYLLCESAMPETILYDESLSWAFLFGKFIVLFPTCFSAWFKSIIPGSAVESSLCVTLKEIETLTKCYFSGALISREIASLRSCNLAKLSPMTLSFLSGSIIAKIPIEDKLALSMCLKFPQNYPIDPLRITPAEGNEKPVGVSESTYRSWLFSSQICLTNRAAKSTSSSSLFDALLLWKGNTEKKFAGIQECPICYSILQPSDKSLPTSTCKTCKNKFHPACLYKWFKSSGNSTCPLCRSYF